MEFKIKIGDKCKIPKTKAGEKNFNSVVIKKAKEINQEFLYYNGINEWGDYLLNEFYKPFDLTGDFFNLSEIELYEEYNETFNPEAHSSLIIDFDKVETIEEAAYDYTESIMFSHKSLETVTMAKRFDKCYITGAKSDAARNYWYQKFIEEQKPNVQLIDNEK